MNPMNCHEMDYIVIVDETSNIGLTPGYDDPDGVVGSGDDAVVSRTPGHVAFAEAGLIEGVPSASCRGAAKPVSFAHQ